MNDDLTTTQLGAYQIQGEIGRKQTDIVYEAHDAKNDRPVILKVLTKRLAHEYIRRCFKKYGQALTYLDHPNVLKVYSYGIDPGSNRGYLVLPYVGGGTLDERLGQPWPVQEAIRVAAQVGRALDYAHQRNFIHGDLRPQNILLTSKGWALLTDFSLARISGIEPTEEMRKYQAPDICDGKMYSSANDLYALGLVTYKMLTGYLPERGKRPKSLHQQRPEIPRSLAEVVAQALSPNTKQRHATAGEMARALEDALPAASSLLSKRGQRITPPSGIQIGIPPRQAHEEVPRAKEKESDLAAAERCGIESGRKNRALRFLRRATKWFAGKVAAAMVILPLVATALVIGDAFVLDAAAVQSGSTQGRQQGWERGEVSVVLEEEGQTPSKQ